MATLHTYLNFNGNTEEAFIFYRSVFGGDFAMFQRFKDTEHGNNLSDNDKEKIMHVTLPIGKTSMLMATDVLESFGQTLIEGNNYSISIAAENAEEGNRLFNGLAAGGQITMPLEKMFWGSFFGMLTDKFGIQWMVSYGIE